MDDALNFTYFDVFRFPFPTPKYMRRVVVVSHWHRDHLPADVRGMMVLCPPSRERFGPWTYEGKADLVMTPRPYDPVVLPDRRRFILIPGSHGYYWVLRWRNNIFLYAGDLNYGEGKRILGLLKKLPSDSLTAILPIYGGIKDLHAKHKHGIPAEAPAMALADEVTDLATRLKTMKVRVFATPHTMSVANWAEEIAVRELIPLAPAC